MTIEFVADFFCCVQKLRLASELDECRSLIMNNRAAGMKHREEFAQMRSELKDLGAVKAELDDLKQSCMRRTELADLQAKLDAVVEHRQQEIQSERIRMQRIKERAVMARRKEVDALKAQSDTRIKQLELAFAQLCVEFYERVGEDPKTQLEPEETARSNEDD